MLTRVTQLTHVGPTTQFSIGTTLTRDISGTNQMLLTQLTSQIPNYPHHGDILRSSFYHLHPPQITFATIYNLKLPCIVQAFCLISIVYV